jgi:hypothetical protein
MNISMEARIGNLALTSPATSQGPDSICEDDKLGLNDDDQYRAETMEFSDDSTDGIDWDSDDPPQPFDDELSEEDGFDWRSSIYGRPVCGSFGRLYWLKIRLRIALLHVRDRIKAIGGDTEVASALPDDFPF